MNDSRLYENSGLGLQLFNSVIQAGPLAVRMIARTIIEARTELDRFSYLGNTALSQPTVVAIHILREAFNIGCKECVNVLISLPSVSDMTKCLVDDVFDGDPEHYRTDKHRRFFQYVKIIECFCRHAATMHPIDVTGKNTLHLLWSPMEVDKSMADFVSIEPIDE